MSTPEAPKPVKLFAGLLSAERGLFIDVEKELEACFGRIEARSDIIPWTVSQYYEPEMGGGLLRCFVAFADLISPERLPDAKLRTCILEQRRARAGGGRRINVDPGYLDAGKVVLASTKAAGHRLYLREGIYGEMTLLFHSGAFQPFVYTYADYLWPETTAFLGRARVRFLEQIKEK